MRGDPWREVLSPWVLGFSKVRGGGDKQSQGRRATSLRRDLGLPREARGPFLRTVIAKLPAICSAADINYPRGEEPPRLRAALAPPTPQARARSPSSPTAPWAASPRASGFAVAGSPGRPEVPGLRGSPGARGAASGGGRPRGCAGVTASLRAPGRYPPRGEVS